VRDRQAAFGQVWPTLWSWRSSIEGVTTDARLITEWEDPAAFSERERLENDLLRKKIGQ
jgi:hypothetical protein